MDKIEFIVNFYNLHGKIVLTFRRKLDFLNSQYSNMSDYLEGLTSDFNYILRLICDKVGRVSDATFGNYYKIALGLNDAINIFKKNDSIQSIDHIIYYELENHIKTNDDVVIDLMLYAIPNKNLPGLNLSQLNNKKIALRAINLYHRVFKFLGNDLQMDQEIALLALRQHKDIELLGLQQYRCNELHHMARFFSKDLLGNRNFVLDAAKIDGHILRYAKEECKSDKEIVLNAIFSDFRDESIIEYASKDLLYNRDFVLAAVKINGRILKYVKEEYKSDKEIVFAAMCHSIFNPTIRYASQDILNDRNFLLVLIKNNCHAIKFASRELLSDQNFLAEAVRQNYRVFNYIPREFKYDFIINKAACMSLFNKKLQALKLPSFSDNCFPMKKFGSVAINNPNLR